MNKADLISKITEILGVKKPKDELAFEIFLEKISERLQLDEALRIPGIGIFQLKEEPFTGAKKSFPGVETGNKTELMFAPFVKDSEALYLTFDVKKKKRNPLEFSDDVFSIGVEQPVVPITENLNDSLDATSSYVLLRKTIGKLVDKLLDKSDYLENFDIWDDFINSRENSDYEVFEEITLDEKFDDLVENLEETEVVQESEDSEDLSELNQLDALDAEVSEETEENVTEETDPVEDSVVEDLPEIDLPDELSEDEAETDNDIQEELSVDDFEISPDDILPEELNEEVPEEKIDESIEESDALDQLENDLEVNDLEIDDLENIVEEKISADEPEEETTEQAGELKDDDFDLSEDELKELLENEEDADDDWDWGDELKQEIVDQDEAETDEDQLEDQLENHTDDLFDQLEESIKEEVEEKEQEGDIQEELTTEEDTEEKETEEEVNSEEAEEKPDEEAKSEETSGEADDKLDSLLQKKEVKLSAMAKIKQKMGILFWILIAVFVLSTAGGVYYFMFIPQEIDLSDPLLAEFETTVVDSSKQDTVAHSVHTDSLITEKKDTIKKDEKNAPNQTAKKPETKKETPVKKRESTNKSKDHSTQVKKNQEQNPAKNNKRVIEKPVTRGKVRVVENISESRIGSSHIYKSGDKYSVQISSWRKKAHADREAQKLVSKGHNVYIVKVYLKSLKGTWYRVRVGDFKSLQEAQDFVKNN